MFSASAELGNAKNRIVNGTRRVNIFSVPNSAGVSNQQTQAQTLAVTKQSWSKRSCFVFNWSVVLRIIPAASKLDRKNGREPHESPHFF